MESLFNKWKSKIPNYSENHRDLFNLLSSKFGAEGEKKINFGKHFSTNYELYTFAFFLGLYNEQLIPLAEKEKKVNFSHEIMRWGSKSNALRKDFTVLQENIFMSLIARSEIDFIALEKGEISENDVVKQLIGCLESYTNGGLLLIKDKLESSPNFFLQPSSFMNLLFDSELNKEEK